MKIYELPVVQVPTNMPMVRDDRNDQVYKTKEGKWSAVEREIAARHAERPAGARRHDLGRGLRAALRAADAGAASSTRCSTPSPSTPSARPRSIAEAGQPGAVTIATNMAGRGVDIKLGGNAEHHARLELAKLRACEPGRRGLRASTSPSVLPAVEQTRRRADRQRVLGRRRPVHLRHRAPRVAAHRQPAARPLRPPGRPRREPLLPVRRGRSDPAVRRRPHLPDPRPTRRRRRRGQRGADRGRACSPSRSRRPRRRSRSRTS